jgi:hypothetical protein
MRIDNNIIKSRNNKDKKDCTNKNTKKLTPSKNKF